MLSKNIQRLNKLECVGCGVCVAVCPTKAIKLEYTNDGFRYPVINDTECISCTNCTIKCPSLSPSTRERIKNYYLCQSKDKENLIHSSSGGVFYTLARTVISMGGYVSGCVFDENNMPKHIVTNSIEDLAKMQGSKYVQSFISADVFIRIKDLLKNRVTVLFCGTPCQVDAVRNYVNDDELLIPIDLICHGVGSPGIFKHHINNIEKQFGETVERINFRNKEMKDYPAYHLTVHTSHHIYSKDFLMDNYYAAFANSRIIRESCYRCNYAALDRVGWFTLGDYLPERNIPEDIDRSKGVSLVCVNSMRGERLLNSLDKQLIISKLENPPIKNNLKRPESRPKSRDKLYNYDLRPNSNIKINKVLHLTLSDFIKSIMPQKAKAKIKKVLKLK